MKNVYEERVYRGVELLDGIEPGWANRIDLKSFDISSFSNCVFAQVFGTAGSSAFHAKYKDLDLEEEPYEYGFMHEEGQCEPGDDSDFKELQQAWLNAIDRRRTV